MPIEGLLRRRFLFVAKQNRSNSSSRIYMRIFESEHSIRDPLFGPIRIELTLS